MNLRLRPRFALEVDMSPGQAQQRFRQCLTSMGGELDFFIDDGQVEITVNERQRHFWSPYLKLRICREEQDTVLRGKFGPNINVWSMFLAAYAVLSLLGATGLLVSGSQWLLDQALTGLWVAAGCLVLSVLVWSAGQLGRRWAYDQTVTIHRSVHEIFADAIVD